MTSEDYNTKRKHVYFRSFKTIMQVEEALKQVKGFGDLKIQISVLGRFPQKHYSDTKLFEEDSVKIKNYWTKFLGEDAYFGNLNNPEIGTVFVMGPLTSILLNKVNGKNLGNMSSGIYGVLRGLGAIKSQVENYLNALKNKEYLLIIRGYDLDLYGLDSFLQKTY